MNDIWVFIYLMGVCGEIVWYDMCLHVYDDEINSSRV